MRVIYPGSFDPLTYGHMDIIGRAAHKFDEVIVAVLHNQLKKGLFTVDERMELLNEVYGEQKNIQIKAFSGLLVDFCKQEGINCLVRGIRTIQDYEFEAQLAQLNKALYPEMETFFLSSESAFSFVSSSFIKDIASFGGNVSDFVPPVVARALQNKFMEG